MHPVLEQMFSGEGTPGAGSAAAMSLALAATLVRGHAELSLRQDGKSPAAEFLPRARDIEIASREILARAQLAAVADADAFTAVLEARAVRDAAQGAARDLAAARASAALVAATWGPLEVCRMALEVAGFGLELAERGRRSAQGEARVAVLLALAAAEGCIVLGGINRKALRPQDGDESASLRQAFDQCESRLGALRQAQVVMTKARSLVIEADH
jgi:formiminotetrahydrofolate cyclodeaminase